MNNNISSDILSQINHNFIYLSSNESYPKSLPLYVYKQKSKKKKQRDIIKWCIFIKMIPKTQIIFAEKKKINNDRQKQLKIDDKTKKYRNQKNKTENYRKI